MYDEIIKEIEITADEMELMEGLLLSYLDRCVSVGEEIVVRGLLDKVTG